MIPEEVVEATWREAASLSPATGRLEMKRLAKRQPDMLAFVLAEGETLTRDGAELTNYFFFVIARMFYAAEARIRRISMATITQCMEEVEANLASLEGAHDRFLERAAKVVSSGQPYVFRYLVEALMEPADDSPSLTEDDKGVIFLILATIIKALDGVLSGSERDAKR